MMQSHSPNQPVQAPTLSEMLLHCFTDIVWLFVFLFGLFLFYSLQKGGERLHRLLLNDSQKLDIAPIEFGTYCQSIVHATLIFIGSINTIHHHLFNEVENQTDSNSEYVIYGIITILSASYYTVMFVYEFYLDQSPSLLAVMLIHHVVCGLGQAPVYILGGSVAVFSSMCFQCEISNLALHISWFSAGFENQWMYRLSGILTLILFPITRLVVLPYAIYMTFTWLGGLAPDLYVYAAIFGEVFIFLMSLCYSVHMWTHVYDWIELKSKTKSD